MTVNLDDAFDGMDGFDKFRFGVYSEGLGFSSIWLASGDRDNYYLGVRSIMGQIKVSLHGSGISHIKVKRRDTIETPFRWQRNPTPPSGVACAAAVTFPTEFIRTWNDAPGGKRKTIINVARAAAPGRAVQFLFLYSKEEPSSLEDKLLRQGVVPLVYDVLTSGEYVSAAVREIDFDKTELGSFLSRPVPAEAFAGLAEPADGDRIENLAAVHIKMVKGQGPVHLTNIQGFGLARIKPD